MDDGSDIDTEENTFMYPKIENIYSDANIKTEPIDIDDEYDSVEIAEVSSDYYMPIPNKIILGSKPSTLDHLEPIPGPSTASDHWEDQENFFECAECNLLFPTQNELDSHKMTSHSFLVARPMSKAIKTEKRMSLSSTSSQSFLEDITVPQETKRRQKAVKSTSKSPFNNTFPGLAKALNKTDDNTLVDINVSVSQKKDASDNADRLLCKHCDVIFPNEIALITHTYELWPETGIEKETVRSHAVLDSQMALKENRAKDFKKTNEFKLSSSSYLYLQCLYCTCFLMYPGFMKKHLMKNHKVGEFAVKRVNFTGKCGICSSVMGNYKKYNTHVMKCHPKIFMARTPYRFDGAAVKMKCLICNQIFTSRYAAYKHKAQKHPEQSQKHTFHTVYDKPIKPLSLNQALKPKQTPKSFVKKTYIPKDTLFKCNKCQIHFVSCSAAFAHSKRCSLARGDWRCNKCRRMFTKSEKFMHMPQHQFTENFKVHLVCDEILNKVLCRCPKCELLFDEMTFAEHISAYCVRKNGLDCKSCGLKISPDFYTKHVKYHKKYNFSSDDFIIIDFVDVSIQNSSLDEEKKDHQQKLMYCTNCNCHFYKMKTKNNDHLEGCCENISKKLCELCGLTFTQKPYLNHIKHVHDLKLTLDNIRFVRIQDWKVINPVMPDFFQCDKCKVRFVSSMLRNNHSCSKQVFVECLKCSQKYDSVTYDIHMTFHNYGRSKKIEKVSSTIKFYVCVACNYGFKSYDSVVEHCQKHYINSEKLVMIPCKTCKSNFQDDHRSYHFDGNRFQALDFDYEKLLTNDWMDGFDSLPKDAVDDILSKSVYGVMRNIRLDLIVQGPVDKTLYKCAQCELNFEQDNILEHTMETCSNTLSFECSSCNAIFGTSVARNNHMNIHVVYGDDISFREILFNNIIDKDLNEALRTGKQKESLKFRKCQKCKLLIKKSDYQAHISAHDAKMEIKQFQFRNKNKLVRYKLFKPLHTGKRLYTVYKCRTCNACVMQKSNMIRHKCGPTERYEKCPICSLYFLACNIKRHIAQHAVIPKFILENISVLEFEFIKNVGKKRRTYSSDDYDTDSSEPPVSKIYNTRNVVGKPYKDDLSEHSQDNSIDDESIDTSMTSNTYAKKYIKKNSIEKDSSDNEEAQNKIDDTSEKHNDVSESILDIAKWKAEMRNKLYQCEICYLCFSHKQQLLSHLSVCDETNLSETPLLCNQCDITFPPSMISFHEKLHDLVRHNPVENYLYLINISTNGVNTSNERQWLYKCKVCNVQYLSTKSLQLHFRSNHKIKECLSCDVCGLKFTQISRTRHNRIHHSVGKWLKEDLHIEITEKKIVNVGKFKLTPAVKAHLHNKSSVEIEEVSKNENQSTDDINDDENSEPIIDLLRDNHEKISDNLYECDICSKHYFTRLTLVHHILSESHKGRALRCDICDLLFEKHIIQTHILIQHSKLKLGRDDFVITKMNQDDMVIEENVTDSEVYNVIHEHNAELNASIDTILSVIDKRNDSVADKVKEMKHKEKATVTHPIDNHLYKCVKCSVYYTNRTTLLLHINVRNHRQKVFVKCDVCGLAFGRGSLQKHQKVQHNQLNLSRKDFIVKDVFGNQLVDDEIDDGSVENVSTMDREDNALMEIEVREEQDDKIILKANLKKKQTKIFRLYQCKDCKVCVQKTERKLHVCCSDIQKQQCLQCSLLFRKADVIQHLRLHRKYRELSRKNFLLVRFGTRTAKSQRIYKCVSCSTHFVSLNSIEWHMSTLNHKTKRDCCKHCGLFFGKYSLSRHIYLHHKKLNLTVQQFDIIFVSDTNKKLPSFESKQSGSNMNNGVNRESTANVNTVKKLFKCVECDVYFLTRASYYQHIYKHRKLDATEYIDCNICDFQFLNESLGVHMKSHKDKSFCPDKLLIEEYQPNTDIPKIKFSFAKDSLNSKLVSTTTLLDNDDENVLNQTDEQLSVIDSTSDEIPKTRANEISDIDANLSPLSSGSSRENGPLNAIEELPSVDVTVKSKN